MRCKLVSEIYTNLGIWSPLCQCTAYQRVAADGTLVRGRGRRLWAPKEPRRESLSTLLSFVLTQTGLCDCIPILT